MENKYIEVNGKKYKKIKKYKHYTLFEDENGFKECFDDFDLGLIRMIPLLEMKKRLFERDTSKYTKNK
jgi:hypothetical protein